MITYQYRLIKKIKKMHARKKGSHATENKIGQKKRVKTQLM